MIIISKWSKIKRKRKKFNRKITRDKNSVKHKLDNFIKKRESNTDITFIIG